MDLEMFDSRRHLHSWLTALLVIIPIYIAHRIEGYEPFYTEIAQTFFLAYIAMSLARKD